MAVRRLRSCLRAYRRELKGSVSKRTRRRLRALAAATNESRDAEVHLAWLAEQKATLAPRQRPGWTWLHEALAERRSTAHDAVLRDVGRDFRRVHTKLAEGLSSFRTTVRLGEAWHEPTAARVAGQLARDLAATLRRLLADVHSPADQRAAHEARIAAKRLRYLLEPLRAEDESVRAPVERLKELQDMLGDLRDAQLFGDEVVSCVAEAAGEHARRLSSVALDGGEGVDRRVRQEQRRDPRAGLLELARRLHHRATERFGAVETIWLYDRAAEFFAEVDALGRRLAERSAPGMEVERKYLLNALPELPGGATTVAIDQGYLPGKQILERLRRVRTPAGDRCFRTVKSGSGVARLEWEEETTPEVFRAMWPLTRGRRLRKRRHEVVEGERRWEIDEFLGRDLVLAELELADASEAIELPEWLRPYVVRDVTLEPEYQNARLAR